MRKTKYIFTILLLLTATAVSSAEVKTQYLDVAYGDRKLPIKVYMQDKAKNCPLIIYSHGLGGNRDTKEFLLRHWAEAGFICVSVQHPGSDTDVIRNARRGQKLAALRDAASAEQFINRVKDIPAALDQLTKWNADKKHVLHGTMDFSRVGMSGHSFGAITSQVMMGAKYNGKSAPDKRFKAFLLMSPSPVKGSTPKEAFGHVTLPVLCMTGTEDALAIQPGVDCKARVSVYNALPEGKKYLYVFDGGSHHLFSGPTRFRRTLTEEHKLIQDLTLLFWQTQLLKDEKALAKLQAIEPQKGDDWRKPKTEKRNRKGQ